MIPSTASNAGAESIEPIAMKVSGLATIMPLPLSPMKARKNPIPAPIASFKSSGIAFNIISLRPEIVIIKKSMLLKNIADKAACHEFSIEIIMV